MYMPPSLGGRPLACGGTSPGRHDISDSPGLHAPGSRALGGREGVAAHATVRVQSLLGPNRIDRNDGSLDFPRRLRGNPFDRRKCSGLILANVLR